MSIRPSIMIDGASRWSEPLANPGNMEAKKRSGIRLPPVQSIFHGRSFSKVNTFAQMAMNSANQGSRQQPNRIGDTWNGMKEIKTCPNCCTASASRLFLNNRSREWKAESSPNMLNTGNFGCCDSFFCIFLASDLNLDGVPREFQPFFLHSAISIVTQ